jgi:hypothetical protein
MVRPDIRDETADTLVQIMDEKEFSSYDRAITYALREAGYDL